MTRKTYKSHRWWKNLLTTFIATTISIVLTFGTAALVDNHKEAKAKRQMSLTILYDLQTSLEQIEKCDSNLREGMELQVALARDTSLLETEKFRLNWTVPMLEFNETAEKIFTSNIETFNTLDNVFFVEKVSDFYFYRQLYATKVVGELRQEFDSAFATLTIEKLMKLDYSFTVFLSGVSLAQMKAVFEQCKELMGVDDEDLTAFTQSRIKNLSTQYDADSIMSVYRKELGQNIVRLEEAKNESRAGKTSVGETPDTGKQ